MSESTTTLIVSIITALGVAGGLIFNAISTRNQTKIQHYQIIKELQTEFSEIDALKPGSSEYKERFVNLHEKIAHLAIYRIIPEEIASYFDGTFPRALLLVQSDIKSGIDVKKTLPNLISWCNVNNFQPDKSL